MDYSAWISHIAWTLEPEFLVTLTIWTLENLQRTTMHAANGKCSELRQAGHWLHFAWGIWHLNRSTSIKTPANYMILLGASKPKRIWYLFFFWSCFFFPLFFSRRRQVSKGVHRNYLRIFQRYGLKVDKDLKFSGLVQNVCIYGLAKSTKIWPFRFFSM